MSMKMNLVLLGWDFGIPVLSIYSWSYRLSLFLKVYIEPLDFCILNFNIENFVVSLMRVY